MSGPLVIIKQTDDAMQMTPSEVKKMTAGQIDKAVANYRALLEKHAGEFNSEAVQTVLGQSELAEEHFQVFRTRVEAISNFIIRKVKVNRSRSPQQAIDATGCTQYTDNTVVKVMPIGEGEEVDLYLIPFKKKLSVDNLEEAVDKAGFVLIDPITLCALNEADPALADTIPNATQWRDKNGKACCAYFRRWAGERVVNIGRNDIGWHGFWFFGCVRKKSAEVSGS